LEAIDDYIYHDELDDVAKRKKVLVMTGMNKEPDSCRTKQQGRRKTSKIVEMP
jgi:hypothetical protein